jgi:N-acetylglucosamine-6-phosphate deacetylase
MQEITVSADTIVTPYNILHNQEITIHDGIISSIRPTNDQSITSDTYDSKIKHYDIVVPGFIDIQVNGIGSVDVASASSKGMEEIGTALLSQGTTTWCPTVITAPLLQLESQLQKVHDFAMHTADRLPHIAGVHLEGPFITVAGAHPTKYMIPKVDLDTLRRLSGYLAIITLAPELDGAMDAISYLSSEGVIVSLGHSNCTAEQAHNAINRGARLVTHLGNAMSAMHHREPGLVGTALSDDRITVSLIADLLHSHPYFLELAFKSKGADHVAIITDSVAAELGMIGVSPISNSPISANPGNTHSTGKKNPSYSKGAPDREDITDKTNLPSPENLSDQPDSVTIPRTASGHLAGSTVTIPQSIANLHNTCGIGLTDCIEAVTASPANLLKLSDRGHIAVGKRGDLVALQKDTFSVQATYLNGTLLYGPISDLHNTHSSIRLS